jgi:exopolysaccharide biosynthesis predicted pyruvyltransferase EpsI
MVSKQRSPFREYIESISNRSIYFEEWEGGNNGDQLITMGVWRILEETRCELVDSPQKAEVILMNGGGWFQDVFPGAFEPIACYRRAYPSVPMIMAPQVFRIDRSKFREICLISHSPLALFARDHVSFESLREADLPEHCQIHMSPDPAFELEGSDFIVDLSRASSERHVLVALRKDQFTSTGKSVTAKLLVRAKGTWFPKRIRRPLSRIRDRLVGLASKDVIRGILREQNVSKQVPMLCRDISVSVRFDEFAEAIRDAALIVTDRLHVAILGHLLGKPVVILCGETAIGDKLRGVYDFSMSGPNSRTSIHIVDM